MSSLKLLMELLIYYGFRDQSIFYLIAQLCLLPVFTGI